MVRAGWNRLEFAPSTRSYSAWIISSVFPFQNSSFVQWIPLKNNSSAHRPTTFAANNVGTAEIFQHPKPKPRRKPYTRKRPIKIHCAKLPVAGGWGVAELHYFPIVCPRDAALIAGLDKNIPKRSAIIPPEFVVTSALRLYLFLFIE